MTKKTRMKTCPECDGQGWVDYERPAEQGGWEEGTEDCGNCDGHGEIVDDEYEEGLGDWLMHLHQDEELDRG